MIGCLKKICATLLLLSFVSFCAFGESLQVPLPTITENNTIEPFPKMSISLEKLNEGLTTLEQDLLNLKLENKRLNSLLQLQSNQLNEQMKSWTETSKQLQKCERSCRIYKGFAIAMSSAFLTSVLILVTLRK